MNNDELIEIEINTIFDSIDKIKNLIENKPHAYYIKQRIETYLFNKLFFSFFLQLKKIFKYDKLLILFLSFLIPLIY